LTQKVMRRCTVHPAETDRVVQNKLLLSKCFIAEMDFAKLLLECLDNHRTDLTLEELLKVKSVSNKVSALLSQIKAEQDRPPEDLPVYPIGGSRVQH